MTFPLAAVFARYTNDKQPCTVAVHGYHVELYHIRPDVEACTLEECALRSSDFAVFSDLRRLSVIGCGLSYLSALPDTLEYLDITGNAISALPGCPNLKTLSMAYNAFTELRAVCPYLQTLVADHHVHFTLLQFPALLAYNGQEVSLEHRFCVVCLERCEKLNILAFSQLDSEYYRINVGNRTATLPALTGIDSSAHNIEYTIWCLQNGAAYYCNGLVRQYHRGTLCRASAACSTYYSTISVFYLYIALAASISDIADAICDVPVYNGYIAVQFGRRSLAISLTQNRTHLDYVLFSITPENRAIADFAYLIDCAHLRLFYSDYQLKIACNTLSGMFQPSEVLLRTKNTVVRCKCAADVLEFPEHWNQIHQALIAEVTFKTASQQICVASNPVFYRPLAQRSASQLILSSKSSIAEGPKPETALKLLARAFMHDSENTIFSNENTMVFKQLTKQKHFYANVEQNNDLLDIYVHSEQVYSYLCVFSRSTQKISVESAITADYFNNALAYRFRAFLTAHFTKSQSYCFEPRDIYMFSQKRTIRCSEYEQLLICTVSELFGAEPKFSAYIMVCPHLNKRRFEPVTRITLNRYHPWKMDYRVLVVHVYARQEIAARNAWILVDNTLTRNAAQARCLDVEFDFSKLKKKPHSVGFTLYLENSTLHVSIELGSGWENPTVCK